MTRPERKSARLKSFDYSAPGAYFLKICTREKRCILSEIRERGPFVLPEVSLTEYGKIAREQILSLPARFPAAAIAKYAIMPNHIHLLIVLTENAGGASPSPTVSDIVCVFKSQTARLCKKAGLFQRSFHDHIIRDEKDIQRIWKYIDLNPARWREDCFYVE